MLIVLIDWEVAAASNLYGTTQQSEAVHGHQHFSHRFVVDISKKYDRKPTAPPLLLLKVSSVNVWNRQAAVGYGFAHLPASPGCCQAVVPTWKPRLSTGIQHLQEYFLGLSLQLENLNYAGIPTNVTIIHLSIIYLDSDELISVPSVGTCFRIRCWLVSRS